ncbi:hypothetical protein ElyMa_000634900 [Elysia marginata]|uniref:Histone H2A/H2B/H3 domain-containing protein n=1 Tax=Elysia marginata TaxID=1093978 RepID=A0AAV4GC34_9GAST|nr:hypothetical protein ElyMa_000634900 [Elysia marginata]
MFPPPEAACRERQADRFAFPGEKITLLLSSLIEEFVDTSATQCGVNRGQVKLQTLGTVPSTPVHARQPLGQGIRFRSRTQLNCTSSNIEPFVRTRWALCEQRRLFDGLDRDAQIEREGE